MTSGPRAISSAAYRRLSSAFVAPQR
jgi:hypothetical protein